MFDELLFFNTLPDQGQTSCSQSEPRVEGMPLRVDMVSQNNSSKKMFLLVVRCVQSVSQEVHGHIIPESMNMRLLFRVLDNQVSSHKFQY